MKTFVLHFSHVNVIELCLKPFVFMWNVRYFFFRQKSHEIWSKFDVFYCMDRFRRSILRVITSNFSWKWWLVIHLYTWLTWYAIWVEGILTLWFFRLVVQKILLTCDQFWCPLYVSHYASDVIAIFFYLTYLAFWHVIIVVDFYW